MGRAEKDYGLPRLTVDEAARVLGAHPGEFWLWLVGELKPSPQQITKWRLDVPEAVIRLYLMKLRDSAPAAAPTAPEIPIPAEREAGERREQTRNKRARR